MKEGNSINKEGSVIYEQFSNLELIHNLKKDDEEFYQFFIKDWEEEKKRKVKVLLQIFSFRSLEEGMTLVLQDFMGWDKPRYLLNRDTKTGFEFMNENLILQTVTPDDIDWNSLEGVSERAISVAKALSCPYPILIPKYVSGQAEVIWTLNPGGSYYRDDDGFGMTNDIEVKLIGRIDKNGKVVKKLGYYR